MNSLKLISKDCNFKAVTAATEKEMIRDSSFNGLHYQYIRQLENTTLELEDAVVKARALESAQKNADSYVNTCSILNAAVSKVTENDEEAECYALESRGSKKCFFCGNKRHRSKCPTKDAICDNCGGKGSFRRYACHQKHLPLCLLVTVLFLLYILLLLL